MKKIIISTSLLLALVTVPFIGSCTSIIVESPGSKPISHEPFNVLLKKYVDDDGMVDYSGLKNAVSQLDKYLSLLESNAPNNTAWSKNEQLTYWINAYNAYTLKLILKYHPISSIKDIGSKIQVPYVNTAWDIKFIKIGDKKLSLNNIEHNIIRKQFEEPRIHFALVCAAKSCPKLRNEAYIASNLDQQLTDQTKAFLADNDKNQISENKIKLSKLFNWYAGDFTKKLKLIDYLNQYAPVQINSKAKKTFMVYDWALNEQ